MIFSYEAKEIERRGYKRLAMIVIYLAGYGPFLCAVTFGAYVKQLRGVSMKWDKTIKTGKAAYK